MITRRIYALIAALLQVNSTALALKIAAGLLSKAQVK